MITCPFCGHAWTPRPGTTNPTTCCSQCGRKFPRPPLRVEVLGRRVPLATDCTVCGRTMAELNVCRVDGEPAFVCDSCLREAE